MPLLLAYIKDFEVHLLQVQIYGYKVNRTRDIILHKIRITFIAYSSQGNMF